MMNTNTYYNYEQTQHDTRNGRDASYDATECIPIEKQVNPKKSGRGRNAKKVSLNSTMMSETDRSETSVALADIVMDV